MVIDLAVLTIPLASDTDLDMLATVMLLVFAVGVGVVPVAARVSLLPDPRHLSS